MKILSRPLACASLVMTALLCGLLAAGNTAGAMNEDDFNAEDVVRAYLSRLPEERERRHCHLCGERYLLENLEDCAGCKEDTCYECGAWRKNPATGESECVCNACLEFRPGWWNGGKAPKVSR